MLNITTALNAYSYMLEIWYWGVPHLIDEKHDNHLLFFSAVLLKVGNTKPTAECPAFRLTDDHELFLRLEALLFDGIDEMKDDAYIPMSQQAVSVIYQVSLLIVVFYVAVS